MGGVLFSVGGGRRRGLGGGCGNRTGAPSASPCRLPAGPSAKHQAGSTVAHAPWEPRRGCARPLFVLTSGQERLWGVAAGAPQALLGGGRTTSHDAHAVTWWPGWTSRGTHPSTGCPQSTSPLLLPQRLLFQTHLVSMVTTSFPNSFHFAPVGPGWAQNGRWREVTASWACPLGGMAALNSPAMWSEVSPGHQTSPPESQGCAPRGLWRAWQARLCVVHVRPAWGSASCWPHSPLLTGLRVSGQGKGGPESLGSCRPRLPALHASPALLLAPQPLGPGLAPSWLLGPLSATPRTCTNACPLPPGRGLERHREGHSRAQSAWQDSRCPS